jgi:hypothetical protein
LKGVVMSKPKDVMVLSMAAQLFAHGDYIFATHLTDAQIEAVLTLKNCHALQMGSTQRDVVMCHYCGMHAGLVFRDAEGVKVQCPDCGPTWLNPRSLEHFKLDDGWLVRKLRAALNMAFSGTCNEIAQGVWELGHYRRRPVILARSMAQVMVRALSIFYGPVQRSNAWVITPQDLDHGSTDVLGGTRTWLRLEEAFAFQGGGLRLVFNDDEDVADLGRAPTEAVYGPFSADFQWAYMDDWPHGPIRLTQAQAKLFGALWALRANPADSATIMRKAGLNSPRPYEVVKVRSGGAGDPEFEGPRLLYERLIQRHKRLGLYQLQWPCSG